MAFELKQNYPNPFNPNTTIEIQLPESGYISLDVFNSLGERVNRIFNGYIDSGSHKFNFNASGLNSGVYFYRLHTNKGMLTRKMTLLR
jgi:hypothetical protein